MTMDELQDGGFWLEEKRRCWPNYNKYSVCSSAALNVGVCTAILRLGKDLADLLRSEVGQLLLLHHLQQGLLHSLPHQHLKDWAHLKIKVKQLHEQEDMEACDKEEVCDKEDM